MCDFTFWCNIFLPFSAYAQGGGVLCSLFVLDGKAQGYGKLTKSSWQHFFLISIPNMNGWKALNES